MTNDQKNSTTNIDKLKEADVIWLKSRLKLWMIGTAILLIVIIASGLIWKFDFLEFSSSIVSLVVLSWVCYKAIMLWYDRFKYSPDADLNNGQNPYRKVFFVGINLMGVILLVVGFAGATLMVIEGDDGSLHKATALMIMIIWSVIFLRYFVWALYFYNINYGLTDKDWGRIFKARQDKSLGIPIIEGSDQGPKNNPYRSQTFGLPPGTVRGMIAFTLLFGAIALTVTGMGLNAEINPDSFFWDHYEFFKTAFLMMIAFYFGDSSMRYLSKRWNSSREEGFQQNRGGTKPASSVPDEIEMDDMDFEMHEQPSAAVSGAPAEPQSGNLSFEAPSALKSMLQNANPFEAKEIEVKQAESLKADYPQIMDNEMSKTLTEKDFAKAVDTLLEQGYIVQEAVIRAVVEVESSGSGLLDDGRAKILFEGHKFWHWLKQAGKNPADLVKGNEDILYEKWTRAHYKGGKGEYDRLQKAMNIDKKAAIYSASWGKFQILGENLEHYIKSRLFDPNNELHQKAPDLYYKDVDDFYDKQDNSEYYHLLDFIALITTKTVKNEDGMAMPLVNYLSGNDPSQLDWDKFAYGYNGKGYKENNYDTKLKRAYERFS
ncbi:Protein of unknown function (DUF3380) [Owenweeksia hongkongensis DSM 17368]|uniref:N-acetylmuramidase domain-containing protein n=1 Tax=Owenweeksia hongkongensis (strain DSM 17368 / CIP 108786 / JCM 12287 / NRRL B-23963 / UST20020801) TaxID=926562 RepID=G8R4C9_OWEHD|nr:N-acetylmuramidase family protein [Owenweeksia hongkongensis]AEV34229.1 Protein of unknown function (DUF3380) [Owenweeksia hongkongensis DSM 17368]